jgi:uncharacterized membrane protein
MIVSIILQLILAALFAVISPILLLPDVSLNSAVPTAIASASNYLALINQVVPLTTLLIVFGTVLLVENTHFGYKLIRWIYQKIPGVS